MSSVRSNLFVARYDAITDISSVRSDLFAYQSYTVGQASPLVIIMSGEDA